MNQGADEPVSEGTIYIIREAYIPHVEMGKHDREIAVCSQHRLERKSWLLGIPAI